MREPPPGVVAPRDGYTFQRASRCRGCDSPVYWWETVNGKPSPHDQDGVSHFATCPARDQFRKPREGTQP
jgi:hypothetical protein